MGVTKAVGERFGKGGIADRMIWFNGFPFLDSKEEHTFGVPVQRVMTTEMTVLPTSGFDLNALEKVLAESKFQGFPIVETPGSKALVGYIGRTELRYGIDRAKRERSVPPSAKCFFTPPNSAVTPLSAAPPISFDMIPATRGQMSIDFSRFIDPTPLIVHPQLPLETAMELFKKMGPRVVLIEHRGRLTGLVTVKDCLKYQFKVEASENPRDDSAILEGQEKLWSFLGKVGGWASQRLSGVLDGRLTLWRPSLDQEPFGRSPVPRSSVERAESDHILDGAQDEADELELEDRT